MNYASFAYKVFDLNGLFPALYSRCLGPDSFTILAFHGINPSSDSLIELRDLINWLSRHYTLVSLPSVCSPDIEIRIKSRTRPKLCITFDDGTYDFIDYFMPLFDSNFPPVTINVVTHALLTGITPLTIRVNYILNNLSDADLMLLTFPGYPAYCPSKRSKWILGLENFIKMRSANSMAHLLACAPSFFRDALDDFSHCVRMINIPELQSIASYVSIGNHSHSHASMKYESDDFFIGDFRKSASILEENSLASNVYAFPNGFGSTSQIDLLLEAGVENVLLTGDRISKYGPGVHARINYYFKSLPEARLRASGTISFLQSMLRK